MTEIQFADCIQRMCQKEKEGLHEVYLEYISFIYSVIYEKVQNRENAEDITSEFFIKLWEKAHTYRPGHGHKGWLATIARNMAVDFLRKRVREELREELPEHAGENTVEKEAIGSLTLKEAMNRLNTDEREIINLKVMGDLTFKEIAKILQLPMGTVTWRYREAVSKLRRYGYE